MVSSRMARGAAAANPRREEMMTVECIIARAAKFRMKV
jgi:hypothetical protein